MPQHGIDGWVLEDYEWEDGIGRFEYSRFDRETKTEETCLVERTHPMLPTHQGWVNAN